MTSDYSFLQKESFHTSCVPHSHRLLYNFSTTCLHQCLTLGRAKKYSCVVRAFQPMILAILLENTIATLH
jgi:hypothetical protein